MKLFLAITFFLISPLIIAQPVKLIGSIKKTLASPSNTTFYATKTPSPKNKAPSLKSIYLLKMSLSNQALSTLKNHLHTAQTVYSDKPSKYPSSIQLGMNDVPVLSQGEHGSCVTFANTAAYNAVLGKGDYISQLCQLTLGRYLEKNSYNYPSGWDGSWGRLALEGMNIFGIVTKDQEQSHGCGGLTQYPMQEPDPENFTTLEEYKELSEDLGFENINFSTILDPIEAFSIRLDTNKILDRVKASLVDGDRLTFGSLLLADDLGFAGAVGEHNAPDDTWVLTTEIARDTYLKPYFAGHEMIITGYDDRAVAIDDNGNEHRGLLTLRNSWGDSVGDHGDFYMSYDYFKLLVIEVNRIHSKEIAIPYSG